MVKAEDLLLKNLVRPVISYSTSSDKLKCISLPFSTVKYRTSPSCLHPSFKLDSSASISGKFDSKTVALEIFATQVTGTFQALGAEDAQAIVSSCSNIRVPSDIL